MSSIYKPTLVDRATGKRVKCRYWRIAYTDEHGLRRSVKGYKDKQATEAKAREIERRVERIHAGLPVGIDRPSQEPVDKLTELWIAELKRLGRSNVHISEQERLLDKVWDSCNWSRLTQVRVDQLNTFLAQLTALGRSPRTLNSYRDALFSFLAFCVRQRWLPENPLANHPKARSNGTKTKPRRAYTLPEFLALLNAAPARRTLYLIAGLSGLRKGELRRLEKRDLTPTGPQPVWHLRAEITKGKRRDVIPMLPEAAQAILPLWQAKDSPTVRLFPRIPRTNTLHDDIARAKLARIDAEGRCLDFHALRYFFCTLLARQLPIQVVRLLMRHRDIRQTCNLYMDLGLQDAQEAVNQLPQLLGTIPA
jgi:integrase